VTSLRELQRDLRRAILGAGDDAAAGVVLGDGLGARARLAVYRHHVFSTLTAALQTTFPVVCRLVDERFFGYAADCYIRQGSLPSGPCLFEYGATFPGFLAGFPPCEGLPYLADVARLEWALSVALHAADHVPLEDAALRHLAAEITGEEVLLLDPSFALLASPWPIDRIWLVNQPEADGGATVDLSAGGVWLEVRRREDAVGFRHVDRGTWVFRRALSEGRRLTEAVGETMTADERFDLLPALAALAREGLLRGVRPSLDDEPPRG
jgi:hypothetical protein